MIKITFPFANNSFVIDSPSIIESHIVEKFLPFSELIKVISDEIQHIVIRVNGYHIKISSKRIGKSYSIKCVSCYDVFKKIINLIRDNSIIYGNVCMLHASFVKIFDKRILLLGESGAGKSTLSAYLHLTPGCECYADDIAFTNYNTMITKGASQYINLRSSSLELLPANCTVVYDDFIERYKMKLNNYTEAKANYIVLLNQRKGSDAQIKIIDKPISVLAQNMYLPYSLKGNIIAASKLVSYNHIYEMCFCNLFSAYNALKNFGG